MYAIIDIETTGGGIRWSRITEIAIFVHDGHQVLESFSSLVNPGMPIPYFISQLTGITNEMVQDAPTFEQIAPQIERLTSNCIFVAHNVQFDYNFVRQEFARIGLAYERDRLCTVRLSRHFLPGMLSYSLGRLCDEINIPISARHRAAGDAEATVKLLERMLQQSGTEQINGFVSTGSPFEQLNKRLKSIKLEDVPQTAGVLYLLDADDKPLFIEGTTNLRRRAVAYLKNKAGKVGKTILPQIADVWFEETGSNLMAILLANERILKEKPAHNKAPAAAPIRWKITATEGADGFLYLGVARSGEGEWGPFATRKLAQDKLGHLLGQFFLCRRYSNFKSTDCAPASCLKACQGSEQSATYNQRALAAITATGAQAAGKLLIDKGRYGNERVVIFEKEQGGVSWGYFEGSTKGYSEEELAAHAVNALKSGNAAAMLRRFLLKNSVQKIFSYGQKVAAAGI
jgi:DNA polymerase-3 subunit epsilon